MPENKWRVRLDGIRKGNPGTLGAGFLIDNRRVLTCAHVVQDATDITVTFEARGRDRKKVKASIVFETAWGGPDDAGDVAVLELVKDANVPPAQLKILPPEHLADLDYQVDDLRAHGYPPKVGPAGTMLRARITSWSYTGEWIPIEAAAVNAEFPRGGFSGAAVFDEHTGHVLGMITQGTVNPDIRVGRMLPFEVIRRYWEDLDDLLDLRWLPPAQARDLHSIVRDAQVVGSYTDLVRQAFPGGPQPPDLSSVWDAIRYSCEEINDDGREDRLTRVLTQIELRLIDDFVVEGLRAWRARLLPSLPDRAEQPASIFVRVDPLREDQTYLVSVSTFIDGMAGPKIETVPATPESLQAGVEKTLPAALGRIGDRDPIIEFALPRDLLLKKRVHEWKTGPFGNPMNDYQVVVRDLARLYRANGDLRNPWLRRSRLLRTPPWPSPDVIECKSKPDGITGVLRNPHVFSLVLASAPTLPQISMILNAGIPVVFWPHARCHSGDHSQCEGHRLANGLKEKIENADFDLLPVLVKDLRLGVGTDHSMALTLLWDDPKRIPPDPPMFTDGDHD